LKLETITRPGHDYVCMPIPILLPKMMPKVMPVMLEPVAYQIPMPDYMLAQMPSPMAKVMDELMPHMIADMVPLVTQPMIDCPTGKTPPMKAP
jgi:hypothetical protein